MATANDVLRVAAGEIGYSRWNDRQRGTKYGRDYASRHGAFFANNGVAYCAMFITWVLRHAGIPVPGGDFSYCPYGLQHMRNLGLLVDPRQARPGDIVFFQWDNGPVDHVGFVELNKGGWLQTIEGNTVGVNGKSGGVNRRTRPWRVVAAVGRPRYDVTAPQPVPQQTGGLQVDGWFGAASVRCLQQVLGTPIDGVVSSQPAANHKYVPNCGDNWRWVNGRVTGSACVKAWQKRVGATPDGFFGVLTVKATQQFLGVSADGIAGATTMKAWQSWLNRQRG